MHILLLFNRPLAKNSPIKRSLLLTESQKIGKIKLEVFLRMSVSTANWYLVNRIFDEYVKKAVTREILP